MRVGVSKKKLQPEKMLESAASLEIKKEAGDWAYIFHVLQRLESWKVHSTLYNHYNNHILWEPL